VVRLVVQSYIKIWSSYEKLITGCAGRFPITPHFHVDKSRQYGHHVASCTTFMTLWCILTQALIKKENQALYFMCRS